MLLFLLLHIAKIRAICCIIEIMWIEHVLANLMYGPMLYERNFLDIYLSQEYCIILFEV